MEDGRFLWIYLKEVPGPQFIRVKPDRLELQPDMIFDRFPRSFFVKEEYLKGTISTKRKSRICFFSLSLKDFRIVDEYPIRGAQNSNPSPDSVILDTKRTTLKLTFPDPETPREFVLTFGTVEEVGKIGDPSGSGNRVWLDILTNIPEEESLGDIYHSYDALKRRSDLRSRALSRSMEPLMENRCVSVVIRRATDIDDNDHDDSCDIETYEVNVRAVPGNASQLYRENTLSMRSKYAFWVVVENTEDLLTQEVSPKESWAEKYESSFEGVFFIKDSEISAPHLVIFSCKESRNELFTVSLDIHTGEPLNIRTGEPRVDVNVPPSAAQEILQPHPSRRTDRRKGFPIDIVTLVFMKPNDMAKYYVEVESGLYGTPHRFITHYAKIRIYKMERPENDRTQGFSNGWGRLTRRIMPNEATDDSADTVSERNEEDVHLIELAV
ncbi:hypothetical protein K435DRAFT_972221 [Dendrothele bispora CBS 962.96]|uniref:Uncharacterized protein n=1 Tax=Dendrothele bispora (strain CBS 962.96) TaxID=1314807 RepID=A0A4S8L0C2_DENBC|nr:hypothetical protein K435DRAFT_972221 [Dendrothele bispora CBS 962.96]